MKNWGQKQSRGGSGGGGGKERGEVLGEKRGKKEGGKEGGEKMGKNEEGGSKRSIEESIKYYNNNKLLDYLVLKYL